jgi:hypothetical protein
MRIRPVAISLSIGYLSVVYPAFGWWAEGHQIVAAIAAQRLNPKAKAAVAAILPPGQTLESIAPWADEIRKERKETGSWHYIDIPTGAARGDWSKYCPEEGCVATAIPKMEKILQDATASREQRDEALRFLVHFIGDMHQPLHAGERQDHGGNLVKVSFEGQPLNLHAAWDGKLLEAWFKLDPEARMKLREGAPADERAALAAGSLDDWLWQSQAAARDAVYAPLDRCKCTTLDQAYLEQAIPVLRLQLLRAGERLGRVLNETLGQ